MTKIECDHRWESINKRGVTDRCTECIEVFPCKTSCGHVDCQLEKPRKCYECGKPISNKNNTLYFLDGPSTKGYPVHKECAECAYYVIL